jgi:hypothetical protein
MCGVSECYNLVTRIYTRMEKKILTRLEFEQVVMWPSGIECQMTNEAFFTEHRTLEYEAIMLSGNFR